MKRLLLLCSIVLATAGAVASGAAGRQEGTRERTYTPVTSAMILSPKPGDWLNWRRTVNNWGYSPLAQITRRNVADLELAWAFPMMAAGTQETAPIVHDGIMFLAGNENTVDAVDAATGDLIWSYEHKRPEFPPRTYIAQQPNRQKHSAVLYENTVILTTADAKLVALNALTGKVVWATQVNDWHKGFSFTAGPLVADGKIFTGTSGCSILESAGECWLTAHDAATGRELWRFNVLDDPNNPKVAESWKNLPPEKRFGGSMWGGTAYDPELHLVYFGTGMPTPYTEVARGTGDGDVLYTNSTLALNADTGKLVWYYQHLPRDNWDMDSPFERLLLDAQVNGQMRKLLVSTPGKSGITFALDRATGKFVWARDTVYQNVVSSIDPVTGRVTANVAAIPTGRERVTACPGFAGGRTWYASSYSPRTNLFYVEGMNVCFTVAVAPVSSRPGSAIGGGGFGAVTLAPGAKALSSVFALNVADGRKAYELQRSPRMTTSILTTAGGLMFGGDSDRYFHAFEDDTGKELWSVRLGTSIAGTPMTYDVNGVQYIAVPAGRVAGTFANLSPGMTIPRGTGNAVYVFRLRRR